jgi:hypothetical protein
MSQRNSMVAKKGVKPRLEHRRGNEWEAIPPKGYRITGTLSLEENKVFVGIKKLIKKED